MRYEDIPKKIAWKADAFGLRDSPLITVSKASIENILEKYAAAYSHMAKENLLADLIKNCTQFQKACKPANPALNALLDVAKRKSRSFSVTKKYHDIICISYEVITGTFDPAKPGNKVRYQGQLDDQLDMRERVRKMKLAINQARGCVPADKLNDKKTLKVFMAPEFYFRGRYGAYSPDVVSQIMPLLRAGDDGTGQPKFDDWLIVFGTAISAAIDQRMYCFTCKSTNHITFTPGTLGKTKATCTKGNTHDVGEAIFGAIIDNVALIQKGKTDHLIAKEFMSGIDFSDKHDGFGDYIRTTTNGKLQARHNSGPSKFQDERMGGGIFNIDGITFGMEVCLDHLQDRLKDAKNLQVVLIPSAGMDINNIRTVRNGITFNADGLRTHGGEVVVKSDPPAYLDGATHNLTDGQVTVFNAVAIP